jgi:hypothetical protein
MLWACCPFSRNQRDSSTLEELVHESMTKRLKYDRASRLKVQHLDIAEDLLDEYWTMEVAMRQGWTLSLVFVVGWSDRDVDGKD